MSIFQIVSLIFIAFIVYKVFLRFQKKHISIRELVFWFLFWVTAGVVIALPQTTSWLASRFGIGRGVDLVTYVIMLFLVYSVFRLTVALRQVEHHVTKLTREIAILDGEKKYGKKE